MSQGKECDVVDEANEYIGEWVVYEEIVHDERAKKAQSCGAEHEQKEAHDRTAWAYHFDRWAMTEESEKQHEEG